MYNKVMNNKKKRYNLANVFAWLYLYTIGLLLPKKWNLWAQKIVNHKSNKKKSDDSCNKNQEKIDQLNEPTNLKKNIDTHDSGLSLNSYSEDINQDESEKIQSSHKHLNTVLLNEIVNLHSKLSKEKKIIKALTCLLKKSNKKINIIQDDVFEKNRQIFNLNEKILNLEEKIIELSNNISTNPEITEKLIKSWYQIAYIDEHNQNYSEDSVINKTEEKSQKTPSTYVKITRKVENSQPLSL